MKLSTPWCALVVCATYFFCGCRGTVPAHPPHDSVAFGGHFVAVENPAIFLTVQNGRFQQGSEKIHLSGTYHAHQIDETSYELHVAYEGKFEGVSETMIFRKDGDLFLIRDADEETDTTFKRVE